MDTNRPVDFICPFCHGEVRVRATSTKTILGQHSIPACNKFQELPVDRFVHQALLQQQGN